MVMVVESAELVTVTVDWAAVTTEVENTVLKLVLTRASWDTVIRLMSRRYRGRLHEESFCRLDSGGLAGDSGSLCGGRSTLYSSALFLYGRCCEDCLSALDSHRVRCLDDVEFIVEVVFRVNFLKTTAGESMVSSSSVTTETTVKVAPVAWAVV